MRQRSALCPRSVQQPLSPSTGAACRSRSAVASATIASRSAAPSAFRRIVRRPTSLRFGEAYIGGEVDIEGDIFAAMRAASAIERLRVPLGTRLAVLAGLLRV